MKVLVSFCIDVDIMECPDLSLKELQIYQGKFLDWLFDKKNDHAYWMYHKGKKHGCSYRSQAFVEWLNTFVFQDTSEKASVLEECVSRETGAICRVIYPTILESLIHERINDYTDWLQSETETGCSRQEAYTKQYGSNKYFNYAAADWMNTYLLHTSSEKAYVIEKQIDVEEMHRLPVIHF